MIDLVGWIMIGFCIAWGTQAVLSVIAQRKLAQRAAKPQTDRFSDYRPPAALIVPFKGVEPALEGNLKGLLTQQYPDYRVLMVVEDEADPAYPLLQEAIKQHPGCKAEVVISGESGPTEGQKIHNQLTALRQLLKEDAGEEVWVFADSDAVPGPEWLGELIGPLGQERTAVTTGFRWLIPEPPPGRTAAPFWAKVTSIINSSTTGLLRRDSFTHAWGGSMAMTVKTAKEGDLLGVFHGAICDDYQVTLMCRALKRRVYFVPECLVASPIDYGFKAMCNFAYRQYFLTRLHVPSLFVTIIAINALYLLGLASAISLIALGFGREHTLFAIGVMALVFITNQLRASYRRRVVHHTLGPATAEQLKPTFLLERWTTPVWLGINLLLLVRTAFGRTFNWRGIRYYMKAPQDIRRL